MVDIPVDRVFIGSCTNSRLEDLRAAARVVRGKHVARTLKAALVVPGSRSVKAKAEQEGLDRIFRDAGFEWRDAGLQHVHRDERRRASARRAQRQHLEPQLRGAPGQRQPHASGEPHHGGGSGDCRTLCGRARLRRGRERVTFDSEKSMQPISKHTGLVAPLDRVNVDTDQMVPKQFLKLLTRKGYGRVLFYDWRYLPGETPNPNFVLNLPRYQGGFDSAGAR